MASPVPAYWQLPPFLRRVATGGLARLAPLPTGATWIPGPVLSTPRLSISVATVLLCAAGQLVTVLLVGVVCNRGVMSNFVV